MRGPRWLGAVGSAGGGGAAGTAARLAMWTGGAAAAAGVAHLLPATSALRRTRCRLAPRLSGVGRAGHVALTFDDGPDAAATPRFLDELDLLGWRATFFLLGSQVRATGSLTAELAARGHELGVHGDAHANQLLRPWRSTSDDIRRARDLIASASGLPPRWFRPPYGAVSSSSVVAARRAGLQMVLWTTWGKDWLPGADARTVAATVDATWHPGATVLLHDSDVTSAPDSWRATLAALRLLAERWTGAGLSVGPLCEHGVGT
jgi:peptidoglycan/xylan/chitin deacetylase (PgdA/CDA1 family)